MRRGRKEESNIFEVAVFLNKLEGFENKFVAMLFALDKRDGIDDLTGVREGCAGSIYHGCDC